MASALSHRGFEVGVYNTYYSRGLQIGTTKLMDTWKMSGGNNDLAKDYDKYSAALLRDVRAIEELFRMNNDPLILEQIALAKQESRDQDAKNLAKKLDYTMSGLSRFYEDSGFKIDNLAGKIRTNDTTPIDKYQALINNNKNLFDSFSKNYLALHENMINGYKTEIKVGQSVRENFQELGYFFPVMGTAKNEGAVLRNAFTLTEKGMDKFLANKSNTRINLVPKQDGSYDIRLSLARSFSNVKDSQTFFQNFGEDVIQGLQHLNGKGEVVTRSITDLSKDFNLVKQAYSEGKILDPNFVVRGTKNEGSELKTNRLTEIIADQNGAMSAIRQIMSSKEGYYAFDKESISFIAGSDVMDRGHELSVKTLGLNGVQLANGDTLKRFYNVFKDEATLTQYVQKSFSQRDYDPSKDRSQYVTEKMMSARTRLNKELSSLSKVQKGYNNLQKIVTRVFNKKDVDLEEMIISTQSQIEQGKIIQQSKKNTVAALAEYYKWKYNLVTDEEEDNEENPNSFNEEELEE